MRIQVVSDLHLEFHNRVPPLAEGADVVVCADDFAPVFTHASAERCGYTCGHAPPRTWAGCARRESLRCES